MAESGGKKDSEFKPPKPLTDSEIAQRANLFLNRHHPSRSLPIPIEQVVEFDLGLNIIPVPNLFRETGFDGFLSSDLREITVDEFNMQYRIGRYHFTLAHEVAHKELHAELYRQFTFSTISEWQEFVLGMGTALHDRLEREANKFAGFVLVPAQALATRFKQSIQTATKRGIKTAPLSTQVLRYVSEFIAQEFEVSAQVVEIRLREEKLFRVKKA